MNNFRQKGEAIEYLIPNATTIASGDVVAVGNLTGIAVTGGTTGDTIVVNLCGVYELPKATPLVITQGDRLFWNAGTKRITRTTTDRPVGTAFLGAASADTTVLVGLYEDGVRFQPGAAVADVATANASDLATAQALANQLKTTVNALLAQLRVAGVITT